MLVIAPYFMRPHREAVRRHFSAIREAIVVPFMLYNIPSTTGVEIPLDEVERLVDEGIIQAFKQSFPDAPRAGREGDSRRPRRRLLRPRRLGLRGARRGGRRLDVGTRRRSAPRAVAGSGTGCRPGRRWWSSRRSGGNAAVVRFVYEAGQVPGAPHWLELTKRPSIWPAMTSARRALPSPSCRARTRRACVGS